MAIGKGPPRGIKELAETIEAGMVKFQERGGIINNNLWNQDGQACALGALIETNGGVQKWSGSYPTAAMGILGVDIKWVDDFISAFDGHSRSQSPPAKLGGYLRKKYVTKRGNLSPPWEEPKPEPVVEDDKATTSAIEGAIQKAQDRKAVKEQREALLGVK